MPTPDLGPTAAVQPCPGCPRVPMSLYSHVPVSPCPRAAWTEAKSFRRAAEQEWLQPGPVQGPNNSSGIAVFSKLIIFYGRTSFPQTDSIFSCFSCCKGEAPRQPQLTPLGRVTALTFRVTGSGLMTKAGPGGGWGCPARVPGGMSSPRCPVRAVLAPGDGSAGEGSGQEGTRDRPAATPRHGEKEVPPRATPPHHFLPWFLYG